MSNPVEILRRFRLPGELSKIECLKGAGGFSGAVLWRCCLGRDVFCLRRWPKEHPDARHLAFIHRFINYLAKFDFIPKLIETLEHQTFCTADGYLWELTEWRPGTADFWATPNTKKLTEALATLGQLHDHIGQNKDWCTDQTPSPGLVARFEQLSELKANRGSELRRNVDRRHGSGLSSLSNEIILLANHLIDPALRQLEPIYDKPTRLQPCFRDIWHDHILFRGNRLTGIVDFGSVRIESPAGDVARLMGSLVADSIPEREMCMEAYSREFQLDEHQKAMIQGFDLANVVLSGLNWIRWLYVENRRFDELGDIEQRLTQIKNRMITRVSQNLGDLST